MVERIRVLQLVKGLGRGGAETLLVGGLRAADRRRFTFGYGYFLPHKNALAGELESAGAQVALFASRGSPAMLLQVAAVARFLRAWRADVVHCHLPLAGVVGRCAARWAGVPAIYTEHNLVDRYHWLTRGAASLTWRWQRHVVAVSEGVAASVERHFGNAVEITLVRNGVDVEAFSAAGHDRQEVRTRLGIPAGVPVIGTVAVFRPQKNLAGWLAAAREISRREPRARFLVVGDGPQRAALEAAAAGLGPERVHFVGLQADVRPYLAAMDLFLMSSSYEGLPIALLEAMAMSVAVVAPPVGGVAEAVVHGETGLLVPDAQPPRLAAAVLELLDRDEARRRMGHSARLRAERHFSLRRMQQQLESLYLTVVEEHRSGVPGR